MSLGLNEKLTQGSNILEKEGTVISRSILRKVCTKDILNQNLGKK